MQTSNRNCYKRNPLKFGDLMLHYDRICQLVAVPLTLGTCRMSRNKQTWKCREKLQTLLHICMHLLLPTARIAKVSTTDLNHVQLVNFGANSYSEKTKPKRVHGVVKYRCKPCRRTKVGYQKVKFWECLEPFPWLRIPFLRRHFCHGCCTGCWDFWSVARPKTGMILQIDSID